MGGLPIWMSWLYRGLYLPSSFHSREHFKAFIDRVAEVMLAQPCVKGTMVLGLGMMLAEFNRTEFRDPSDGMDSEIPGYIINSPIALPEFDMLQELVTNVL